MFIFDMLRHAVLLACVTISLAAPHWGSKSSSGVSIEQRMLLPEGRSIPDEMFGPEYIWDTKGWPVRMEEPAPLTSTGAVRPPAWSRPSSYDSPIFFRDDSERLVFPSNQEHRKTKPSEFDIEQRMLLPEGYTIPDEMYGPNYIWDTKGWPTYVENVPETVTNNLKTLTRKFFAQDSPIVFQDVPTSSRHFGYPQQNYLKRQTKTR
ncbi:uncharacterized protein [Periplaneta americana]|uniref:uncharacterized protein n=1 Tax=Periplaneta americana TaxID=6978 RepID=UPI0037E89EFD